MCFMETMCSWNRPDILKVQQLRISQHLFLFLGCKNRSVTYFSHFSQKITLLYYWEDLSFVCHFVNTGFKMLNIWPQRFEVLCEGVLSTQKNGKVSQPPFIISSQRHKAFVSQERQTTLLRTVLADTCECFVYSAYCNASRSITEVLQEIPDPYKRLWAQ